MPEPTTKLGLADSRTNVTEAHVDDIHLVRGEVYDLTNDQAKRLRAAGVSLTEKTSDDRPASVDMLVEDNSQEDLQAMAAERGLPTSGTKSELAAAILDHDKE